MRKLVLIFLLLSTITYGRALRLCLSHFGNNTKEIIKLIEVKEVSRTPQPAFTKHYGYYKLKIEKGNKTVFYTYFNSLFYEYSTTKNKEIKKFEECFFIPYFKPPFKITVSQLGKRIFCKEVKAINKNSGFKVEKLPENKIKIALISDNYNSKGEFIKDCDKLEKEFLSYKPYSNFKQYFVFKPVFVKNKTFTNKNTFAMKRYITVSKVREIYNILEKTDCDFFVVIVNSENYGGSGILNNFCCVTAKNKYSGFVFVHEFGHYFAGLGDEYYSSKTTYNGFYPKGFEPLEPNLTRQTELNKIKWKNLIKKNTPIPTPPIEKYKNTIGLFEGGGYIAKGIYRSQLRCIMKDRGYNKFCKVCEKTITDRIREIIKH